MVKFTAERLQPVSLTRYYGKDEVLDAADITRLRGGHVSLNWLQREGRPDISGDIGLLMQSFPEPTAQVVKETNDLIKYAKETGKSTALHIWSIPPSDTSWFLGTDASLGNAKNNATQSGHVAGMRWRPRAPSRNAFQLSLLSWRSHRLPREHGSTLSAEALSLAEGLAELEWLQVLWQEIFGWSDVERWADGLVQSSECFVKLGAFGEAHGQSVVDAKSLYDHLSKECSGTAQCKRTAIVIAIIRRSMERLQMQISWVPGQYMLADCLTKKKGQREILRTILEHGWYATTEEGWDELRRRGLVVPGRRVKFGVSELITFEGEG